ncbi:hypothetical protein CMT52_17920 [Elizabethkingia anophelis]|nr:hypothetical protein [Elizabethkingia anophelis]
MLSPFELGFLINISGLTIISTPSIIKVLFMLSYNEYSKLSSMESVFNTNSKASIDDEISIS